MTASLFRRCRQALIRLAVPVAVAGPRSLDVLYRSPVLEPELLLLAGCIAQARRRVANVVAALRSAFMPAPQRPDEAAIFDGLARLCDHQHRGRLACLVGFLAREAGLPDAMAIQLGTASALHGLGRLLSPQPCDRAAEASLVFRILDEASPLSACARDMACFYRERWDGKGSILGLAGNQLPVSARLLAVAVAVDRALPDRLPLDTASNLAVVSAALVPVMAEAGGALDPVLTGLLHCPEALVHALQPDLLVHPALVDEPGLEPCFSIA